MQTRLVILTRDATLWTATLPGLLHDPAPGAPADRAALNIQPAEETDTVHLLSTASADASAAGSDGSSVQPMTKQLYGKSVCYCPATAMYLASLGNASDEAQNVSWLVTMGLGQDGVAQLSCHPVQATLPSAQPVDESASASVSASTAESVTDRSAEPLQQSGVQTHSGTEADASEPESEAAESQEGLSNEGAAAGDAGHSRSAVPSVERSYAVPLLPVSRQTLHSPGLMLGVPSHGLPGIAAAAFLDNGAGTVLAQRMHAIAVWILAVVVNCCVRLACTDSHPSRLPWRFLQHLTTMWMMLTRHVQAAATSLFAAWVMLDSAPCYAEPAMQRDSVADVRC